MRTHGLSREELREAPLYIDTLIGVGIVRAPELGEVLQHLVVHTSSSTRAEHHRQTGILGMQTCEHIIDTTHMIDIQASLVMLEIRRIDVGDDTIAVPLEVSHVRILRHDTVHYLIHIILHLRIGDIQYKLVAIVIGLTIGLHDDPVGMFLEEFTLGIDHLWLYPDTKLHTCLLGISHQARYSFGQLILGGFPVTQSSAIVLARILIGKPSVIKQEHVHTQVLGIFHQFCQTLLIEVETCVLPVVEQSQAILCAHVHLIKSCPVMKVSAGLTHTMIAESEDKLRCGEHLTCLQPVIRSIRIDGRYHTQGAHIIHFKGKLEISWPSYSAQHHLPLTFSGRSVKPKFEEWFLLHGSTCPQFGIHYLLTLGQLCGLWLTFLGPVAMISGHVVTRRFEVKHRGGIAPQGDSRFLLV